MGKLCDYKIVFYLIKIGIRAKKKCIGMMEKIFVVRFLKVIFELGIILDKLEFECS